MAVLVRIGLRYVSGALIAKGMLSPELGGMISSDPEVAQAVQIGVGLAAGAASEGWYMLARKFGWAK